MTVGLRCGGRTRGVSCISPSRAVAGLVDFSRNVVCMMYSGLCHLAVSIEADVTTVLALQATIGRAAVAEIVMTIIIARIIIFFIS